MDETLCKPQKDCKPAPNDPSGTSLRVPFGLKDSRMWAPKQVPAGKGCGCRCPACGGALVAKAITSRWRRPHFAHLRGSNCKAGYETAIHLKAKQLIADERRLWLPAWDGTREMPNPPQLRDSLGFVMTGRRVEFPARQSHLTDALVEHSHGDYIPDVTAHDDHGKLLIEIRVSHAVDDLKLRRIQSEGLRMIEIDLSRLRPAQVYDEAEFRRCVLDDVAIRQWLSCPSATEAWRASLQELKAALAEHNLRLDEQRAQIEIQRREQEAIHSHEVNEAERRLHRRNAFREQLRRRYHRQLTQLPELVDPVRVTGLMGEYQQSSATETEQLLAQVPVSLHPLMQTHHRDGWIYGAHPLLWQLLIYRHFVHAQPTGARFNQRDAARWVLGSFPKEQVLYDLFIAQYRARAEARQAGFHKRCISFWAFTPEENALIPDFYRPINHFIGRLVDAGTLGLVTGIRGEVAVAGSHSARRPNGIQTLQSDRGGTHEHDLHQQ